jgi:hypothetical protein
LPTDWLVGAHKKVSIRTVTTEGFEVIHTRFRLRFRFELLEVQEKRYKIKIHVSVNWNDRPRSLLVDFLLVDEDGEVDLGGMDLNSEISVQQTMQQD